ncbi:MAG TPA: hypothetical protein IAC83_05280 [Euryarchaeota archaeon]|jgi:PHD/YefM family antitoxin component YafN of YafNO toxin-antitoxin module|nr:hypothetical protein [Euryarchaeota archaeon]
MATYDVPSAQAKMHELVDRSLMGEKITISTGAGNIVMISEEDWDSLVEMVSMMTVPAVLEAYKSSLKATPESA